MRRGSADHAKRLINGHLKLIGGYCSISSSRGCSSWQSQAIIVTFVTLWMRWDHLFPFIQLLIASQQPFNFDCGEIAWIEFMFVYMSAFLRRHFGGGSFSQSWLTDITLLLHRASAAESFPRFAAQKWTRCYKCCIWSARRRWNRTFEMETFISVRLTQALTGCHWYSMLN